MDLINLGSTTLDVRLQFEDPMSRPAGGPGRFDQPIRSRCGKRMAARLFSLNPSAFTATLDG